MRKRELILTIVILVIMTWGFVSFNNHIKEIARPEIEKQVEQPKFKPYDVPLSAELQEYTYNLCQEKNVPYELVLAVIEQESSYKSNVISKTGDYGIMQINKINHGWLEKEIGISDFLDPKQNIAAGVYMLSNLLEKYEDEHKALTAYNRGERGARGLLSSRYSRSVLEKKERIEK